MRLPVIFMFSGQGSQYYQMGKVLFESNKTFKDWMIKADLIYQNLTGVSLLAELYDEQAKKSTPFTQTILSHPAIFMVEYALTQVFSEHNIKADLVLGASMGEIASAAAAEIFSFEAALQIVIKQAQILQNCDEGGMLAILHNPDLYQTQSYLNQHSELAAVNFDKHFVVSGTKDNLQKIVGQLNENNITSQLLPVSLAFHSSLIDAAQSKITETNQLFHLQKPSIPIISCATGNILPAFTHAHLWEITRLPILFQKTIQFLEQQAPFVYIDMGPSGTLSTFVKYNLSSNSKSKTIATLTPFENNKNKFEDNLKNIAAMIQGN